jgi:hypothetical protein
MKIQLKNWQTKMLWDLIECIPAYPRRVLEEQVFVIAYGDLSMGDGWYDKGRVEISPAIRHPRLLIERTLHECGHGIEEWLSKNGFPLYSCNIDRIADGFALSLLYPEILSEPDLKQIRKIYIKSLFVEGFPNIDTEGLIARYVRNSEELLEESLLRRGSEVSKTLKSLFEEQKEGFLRRHSTIPGI